MIAQIMRAVKQVVLDKNSMLEFGPDDYHAESMDVLTKSGWIVATMDFMSNGLGIYHYQGTIDLLEYADPGFFEELDWRLDAMLCKASEFNQAIAEELKGGRPNGLID